MCLKPGCRYGSKLNFEKELGLRLKGENGIMKKKFSALQKDIEDQREEIRTMFAQKKELYQVWSSRLGQSIFVFILCLTVWGVEPDVTHQTSWLGSTGECVVPQNSRARAAIDQSMISATS